MMTRFSVTLFRVFPLRVMVAKFLLPLSLVDIIPAASVAVGAATVTTAASVAAATTAAAAAATLPTTGAASSVFWEMTVWLRVFSSAKNGVEAVKEWPRAVWRGSARVTGATAGTTAIWPISPSCLSGDGDSLIVDVVVDVVVIMFMDVIVSSVERGLKAAEEEEKEEEEEEEEKEEDDEEEKEEEKCFIVAINGLVKKAKLEMWSSRVCPVSV